jgi:hypothetical protein
MVASLTWSHKMKYTFDLPESFTIARAGAEVSVGTTSLPASIIAKLIEKALVDVVGDAAASSLARCAASDFGPLYGKADRDARLAIHEAFKAKPGAEAKIVEDAEAVMQKRVDALVAGRWTVRKAAESLSAADKILMDMVVGLAALTFPPKTTKDVKDAAIWAAFEKLDPKAQAVLERRAMERAKAEAEAARVKAAKEAAEAAELAAELAALTI